MPRCNKNLVDELNESIVLSVRNIKQIDDEIDMVTELMVGKYGHDLGRLNGRLANLRAKKNRIKREMRDMRKNMVSESKFCPRQVWI